MIRTLLFLVIAFSSMGRVQAEVSYRTVAGSRTKAWAGTRQNAESMDRHSLL
jgi:hypothetical protein